MRVTATSTYDVVQRRIALGFANGMIELANVISFTAMVAPMTATYESANEKADGNGVPKTGTYDERQREG